ncbi:MAG: excinuclease ABC subunit UvrC [Planctomycetota bacterium]
MPALEFELAKVKNFPTEPGCYIFTGKKNEILYVGKAVNLRSRVRSYFNKNQDDRLVTRYLHLYAARMDFVVTGTEKDALILENSLIKKHKPRFNVRLTDDKTYFSLRIDLNEPWPWLTIVRKRRKKEGVLFFGPYPSASACRGTLQFLNKIFPLRTCKDSVLLNRIRPCISYEIKRCVAPCVDYIERAEYMKIVEQTLQFLKGKNQGLIRDLKQKMKEASESLDFEAAALLRDRIQAINTTIENPRVTKNINRSFDVVGLYTTPEEVSLTVLFIRDGVLSSSASFRFEPLFEIDELLRTFLGQFYGEHRAAPEEVILPEIPADSELIESTLSDREHRRVELIVPERGEKKKLLRLAERNAEHAWIQRNEDQNKTQQTLQKLRHDLQLVRLPRRIECFDVSNLMGRHVVASCVAFTAGRPDKARYRRYKIRTVEGQDDFASMAEILERRLLRGLKEDDLPDLMVIDGGKGQLNAVNEVFRRLKIDRVDLISLAKAREEKVGTSVLRSKERVFKPGEEIPIVLNQSSDEMMLLIQVRNEAHRFAITYHRHLRGKAQMTSILEMVPGIGKQRARALLKNLGSIAAVREADSETLEALPGITPQIIEGLRQFFETKGNLPEDPSLREDDEG